MPRPLRSTSRPLLAAVCALALFFSIGRAGTADTVSSISDGGASLRQSGERAFLAGRFQEAAVLLEKARTGAPRDPRLLGDLGRVYFHLGQTERSEQCLHASLSQSDAPAWVSCWSGVYLARLHIQNGDTEAAEAALSALAGAGTDNCNRQGRMLYAYIDVVNSARTLKPKLQTAHFTVFGPGAGGAGSLAPQVRKLEDDYRDIARVLGAGDGAGGRIRVYVHPDRHRYRLWEARRLLSTHRGDEIHVHEENAGFARHELVHLLAKDTVGTCSTPLLTEGLAEYLSAPPWGLSLDKWVNSFVQMDRYVPIRKLLNPESFRRANPIVAYEEAGSFVKHIVESAGMETFRELCGTPDPETAGSRRILLSWEKSWLARIRSQRLSSEEMAMAEYRVALGRFYRMRKEGESIPRLGFGMGSGNGVCYVAPSGPAAGSGLKTGDVVVRIGEEPAGEEALWRLKKRLLHQPPGDVVRLTVERDGAVKTFHIPATKMKAALP